MAKIVWLCIALLGEHSLLLAQDRLSISAEPVDTETSIVSIAAEADTSLSPPAVKSEGLVKIDDKVLWPMMRGETLRGLAQKWYPESLILQQRFIQKTLAYSRQMGANLKPDTPFLSSQLITIPDEKSVRASTQRIKKAEELQPTQIRLKTSYFLHTLPKETNTTPLQASQPHVKPAAVTDAKRLSTSDSSSSSATQTSGWQLLNITVPEFSLPELRFPDLSASSIDWRWLPTPDIDWPQFGLPTTWEALQQDWSNKWGNIRGNVQLLASRGYQAQQEILIASQRIFDRWRHQDVRQLLTDYQLRNAALVSTLVFIIGLFWYLQRQHERRHAKALATIQNMVTADAEFVIRIPEKKIPEVAEEIATDDVITADKRDDVITKGESEGLIYDQRDYR